MVVSMLSMIVFRVGFSYLLVYTTNLGVLSVWIAMMVDWIVRSACFLWRYFSGRWKRADILKKGNALALEK
jgi:Na+-driven multidrug efflux pump